MPRMGADIEAGTLVEWYVEPGDPVCRGDRIADVETESGAVGIAVVEDGVVDEILVQPGETVPVGAVLARIRSDDADAPGRFLEWPGESPSTEPGRDAVTVHPSDAGTSGERAAARSRRRIRASPLARRVATDLHVDLTQVAGSGPDGAIQRADVERVARERSEADVDAAPPLPLMPRSTSASSFPETVPQARQGRARVAAPSNRESPHYDLETHVDLQRAMRWLEDENATRSIQHALTPLALFVKAVAHGLHVVPELNGFWRNDRHEPQEAIHVGVVLSLREGGGVVPTIYDADSKSVDAIMTRLNDLVMRARTGSLWRMEGAEATISVMHLDDLAVDTLHGVIYAPQVALVGVGAVRDRPWADDGMLDVRPVVTVSLAGDHRATDARQGAVFLDAVRAGLLAPETL